MTIRLAIHQLHNRCQISHSEQQLQVNRELKGLSDPDRLNRLMTTHLERLLQPLGPDIVVRIRSLRLQLKLGGNELAAGRLAELFSRQLLGQIDRQLCLRDANIIVYGNTGTYIASLVADLLDGRAWQQWQYREFEHLRYLDDLEAVLHLLLPRGPLVAAILPELHRSGRIAALCTRLRPQQAEKLFCAWAGDTVERLFASYELPSITLLSQALASIKDSRFDSPPAATAPLALAALSRVLAMPEMAGDTVRHLAARLWCTAHWLWIRQRVEHLPALLHWLGAASPEGRGDEPPRPFPAAFIELRSWLNRDAPTRDYLRAVAQAVALASPSPVSAGAATSEAKPAVNASGDKVDRRVWRLEDAGLLLLFPIILHLRLHRHCRTQTLRWALAQTLSLDSEVAPRPEPPWLSALLPDDTGVVEDQPGLPALWQLSLSQPCQTAITSRPAEQQLPALLLAHFASRLSGLQASTSGYLQTQFLCRPGSLEQVGPLFIARLHPIPLGIVLRMCGLTQWQDELPWLADRQLRIEVAL